MIRGASVEAEGPQFDIGWKQISVLDAAFLLK
jgi:hypothetical protein